MTDVESDERHEKKVLEQRATQQLPESHTVAAEWLDGRYGVTNWSFDTLENIVEFAQEKCKKQRTACAQSYFDKQMKRAGGGKSSMESPVMMAIAETPIVI